MMDVLGTTGWAEVCSNTLILCDSDVPKLREEASQAFRALYLGFLNLGKRKSAWKSDQPVHALHLRFETGGLIVVDRHCFHYLEACECEPGFPSERHQPAVSTGSSLLLCGDVFLVLNVNRSLS